METTFKRGDRVRFSAEGRNTFRRNPDRLGTITNPGGSCYSPVPVLEGCVRVHWDGRAGPETYARAFLELATPSAPVENWNRLQECDRTAMIREYDRRTANPPAGATPIEPEEERR